jgi:FkbM family methyltransferase
MKMMNTFFFRKLRQLVRKTVFVKLFENDTQKNINKLKLLPRFVEGKVILFDKEIHYPDAASVISTYNEIFVEEVYKFRSENSNPLIIDLGANIGLSIMYFKQIFPDAEIIALEADPKVFLYLEKNISVFNWNGVTIINKAAHNKDTTLKFFSEGADGGRVSENGEVTVDAIDIQKIFPENRVVELLKIDIEGAEVSVLERCAEKLEMVKKIFIEYHSSVDIVPQQLSKILTILESIGFRYNIQHVYDTHTPFIKKDTNSNGFDLQLEIFAWRNK